MVVNELLAIPNMPYYFMLHRFKAFFVYGYFAIIRKISNKNNKLDPQGFQCNISSRVGICHL